MSKAAGKNPVISPIGSTGWNLDAALVMKPSALRWRQVPAASRCRKSFRVNIAPRATIERWLLLRPNARCAGQGVRHCLPRLIEVPTKHWHLLLDHRQTINNIFDGIKRLLPGGTGLGCLVLTFSIMIAEAADNPVPVNRLLKPMPSKTGH